jgi:peptidoglycan-associated lipoprotein
MGWLLVLGVATGASAQSAATATATAQSSSASQQSSQSATTDENVRPATNTFFGDTGLWFVPTAEVLPAGKWSGAVYRRGTNYIEGYTNVGDFAGTFAYGIKGRAEIFGSLLVDTRIARNLKPVFITDPSTGGVVAAYPQVNQNWTGDNFGDFYVGAKVNLWSQASPKPTAIAVRGIVKLPTGNSSAGVSTGKADVFGDLIVSKEIAEKAEVSGFAGFGYLGSPDNFSTPTGVFRWGVGAEWPSRSALRGDFELNGNAYTSSGVVITGAPVVGVDGSISPLTASTENLTRATAALTWQMKHGFFIGGGVSWNVPMQDRTVPTAVGGLMSNIRDYVDWQVRIGYHPGVRTYVPPAPAPPPPPTPAPPPPPVHNLTVHAACDPCTVDIGQNSTVTATVQDSISCSVTYRWSAPSGVIAQPAERQTRWTASSQPGSVPVTVTVTCPSDNKTASDTVNIQVNRPVVKDYTFEDVYFDFDRYSLRPEATRVLDEAITALRDNPTLRVEIEGHTCNIGTAEYNLALGDRRANAVKDYLVSRGVSADRLRTISYGEERPKYDNSREETRRLNRRAALVVNLR